MDDTSVTITIKIKKRETWDAIAKVLGYHNYMHMKRPRMKQRWKRKHSNAGN